MLTNTRLWFRNITLDHLILGTLLVYVPLHMIDEGIFNFAAWAELHWHIPNYTLLKWLLHNVYFAIVLGIGFVLYRRNPASLLPAGLGIVLWGFMNGVSHIIFTFIFWEYSPGLISGLIFIFIALLAYQRTRQMDFQSSHVTAYSILAALFYWGIPMFLFIEIDKLLRI